MFGRHVEDIRIQKLQKTDACLFITSFAELSHFAEPLLIFKCLFGDFLHCVPKLLGDQTFEFAERLRLKDRSYRLGIVRMTFADNQFPDLLEKGYGWIKQFLLDLLFTLEVRDASEVALREP
jgi:hypothetical protein